MRAPIFDIQRFSVDDGPGIRPVVFFGGCPLSCLWCHNPEGLTPKPRLLYNVEKCLSCGACVSRCPSGAHSLSDLRHLFDRSLCTACGACTEICVEDALRLTVREMSLDEVVEELLEDAPFYETSGGGVTLSGGEPLIREDFVLALTRRLHEAGVSVAVETSGYIDGASFERIAREIDLFLFDFKESEPERHLRATGVPQEKILRNLDTLGRLGRSVVLRCPIIPSVNDRESHAAAIAAIAERYANIDHIEIMPYHSLGLSKYEQLGISPEYASREDMTRADADAFVARVQSHTARRVCVG